MLDKHFGDAADEVAAPVVASTATAAAMGEPVDKGVKAAVAALGVATSAGAVATSGTAAVGHAHGVADEAEAVTGASTGGQTESTLKRGRDAQAEAGEEGREGTAGDEGHDDHEEDLPGVALEPVYEVANEALELLVGALHEALARGALIVRRTAAACEEEGDGLARALRGGGGGGAARLWTYRRERSCCGKSCPGASRKRSRARHCACCRSCPCRRSR